MCIRDRYKVSGTDTGPDLTVLLTGYSDLQAGENTAPAKVKCAEFNAGTIDKDNTFRPKGTTFDALTACKAELTLSGVTYGGSKCQTI